MGKFVKALKKIGRGTVKALTSDAAKKLYTTLGKAATRFAESEVGSAAIDGLIQGTAQTLLHGGSASENIKQAVVLGVLHSMETPADPLSPGEQGVYDKIKEIKREEKEDRFFEVYQEKIDEELGSDMKRMREVAKGDKQAIKEMGGEIKVIEKAFDGLIKIDKIQDMKLTQLYGALAKERTERTQDEIKMVNDYTGKIEALQSAITVERDAMQEEALQEIIEMGTDVIETASEEVPIFGPAAANVVATGRMVEGTLKLKQVIEKLAGLDVSHTTRDRIEPKVINAILDHEGGVVPEKELAIGVYNKLQTVREHMAEHSHLKEMAIPRLQKLYTEHGDEWHPKIITQMKVAREHQPQIHIYCAPWESDDVFMLRVYAPHHIGCGLFLGVDLESEFIFYEDLIAENHVLRGGVIEVVGRNFRQAVREFLLMAASKIENTMHVKRLVRSSASSPIYLSSIHYECTFDEIKQNVLQIVHDEQLQMHLLRGPKHFQRRALMAAVVKGVKILEGPDTKALMLQGL
ncbi:VP5 [Orungo virus]|uniref:Outer capsid protein VP5 n=1 Tax=Orungo virus TaxID=40058 RepID=W5QLX6_9REOV|nr:VP5 [Orungo virus]AFX73392.1 VP5 [Orungo virus]